MPELKKIYLGVPNYRGLIEAQHHVAMLGLYHAFGSKGINPTHVQPTNTIVSGARQHCVLAALADPECSHILWIDDDMVFTPDQVFALINEAVKHDLDYLAALAFANSTPTKPVCFGLDRNKPEGGDVPWWYIVTNYPKDSRFRVYATGFGMVLTSTRMLRGMKGAKDMFQWFVYPHNLCPNEDVAFCINANKAGYKLYMDSRIKILHISKDRPLIGEELYEAQGDAIEYALGLERNTLLAYEDSPYMVPIKDAHMKTALSRFAQIVDERDRANKAEDARNRLAKIAEPTGPIRKIYADSTKNLKEVGA